MAEGIFTIEIKNIKEVTRALKEAPQIAEPILQKAILAIGAIAGKNTKKNDPVPWRTGRLLQSFQFKSGKLIARWFPTANYAGAVEFGRGEIRPQGAKPLSWVVSSGGGYVTSGSGRRYYKSGTSGRVFAKYARAAPARPYMGKIKDSSEPEIQKLLERAMEMVAEQLAK